MTFAKRAQVGVVMSRFADPEPASAHNASLVRGRIHADMVSTSHNAERLEKLVAPRLAQLARAYPHLVQAPRAAGYAFAFDLPTAGAARRVHRQRFWRGAIVFAAGTRTARYRLSDSFLAREIDLLFETIRRSLSWLDAHDGQKPPEWEDPAPRRRRGHAARRRTRSCAIARCRTARRWSCCRRSSTSSTRSTSRRAARRRPRSAPRSRIREGSLLVAEAPRPSGAHAARRVRDRRAARAQQGRRGLRRRSDARQAQHDVLGVDHGRAELPERGHRPQAQGAAAARRRGAHARRRLAALSLRHRAQPRRPHRAR